MKKDILVFGASILLVGCGGGGSNYVPETTTGLGIQDDTQTEIIKADTDFFVKDLGEGERIKIKVEVENKDVFLLLTNKNENRIDVNLGDNVESLKSVSLIEKNQKNTLVKGKINEVMEFNKNFKPELKSASIQSKSSRTSSNNVSYQVDDTKIFYTDLEGEEDINSTLKYSVLVDTKFGYKTLNIWRDNNADYLSQEKIDVLGDRFLKDGDNNDIYDNITNVMGEEYANNNYIDLIEKTNVIDILLYDIDNDKTDEGGAIGYFWIKDLILKSTIPGSNENTMFYIDSFMLASEKNDNAWLEEIISTLSHEFQHMETFTNKTLIREETEGVMEDWLNEMVSMSMEDLIAVNINNKGVRGIEAYDGTAGEEGIYSAFSEFNNENPTAINAWYGSFADYGKVASFGTFLIRNYGGAELLRDIVHNNFVGIEAIEYAVQKQENGKDKTFFDLIKEWGIAVMLSDYEDLGGLASYNTGGFTYSEFNGIQYPLGSINFFNYIVPPKVFASGMDISGNAYTTLLIKENASGFVETEIDLPTGVEATLIVK